MTRYIHLPSLEELVAVRRAVDGDTERLTLYRQLARYAAQRRELAPGQSTPWLDRRIDQLLDELLVLRGHR